MLNKSHKMFYFMKEMSSKFTTSLKQNIANNPNVMNFFSTEYSFYKDHSEIQTNV